MKRRGYRIGAVQHASKGRGGELSGDEVTG
jgi:hypothetical protein